MSQSHMMRDPKSNEVKRIGLNEWARYRRMGWEFVEGQAQAAETADTTDVLRVDAPTDGVSEDDASDQAKDEPSDAKGERFDPASKKKASKKKASKKKASKE